MFLSRLHCQLVLASLRLELGEMQEVLFEGVFRVRILSETSGHGHCECPDVFLPNRSRVLESTVALWPPEVPSLLEEVSILGSVLPSHHMLQAFQLLQDAELCMTRPGRGPPLVQWPQVQPSSLPQ